ncbi:site-specific DNA-methyltransferase [Rhizobium leguminosarum]|uniref:site-specific DNA-methyltransferase n=1 Tax=Rhizobium leguminosarum TaxID=384 RepID=UPI001C919BCD|nr:site-specific DNA-methyltransferase [Rhizobium leguminosarum]MBY3025442.1 site-specific DNA-methyltransferase [Rhizobium leguminosarum]
MSKKTKLELTWIGKDERPKLEPRILIEDPTKSYHASVRRSEADIFDNMLIHGDNLLALKALESDPGICGQVKCVFIDPPYNTGSAFEHYDDGLEHSIWLSLMRDRLELLKDLLHEDGSIWITIDDNEAHYLKVLCDEVFGRRNFIANLVWQKRASRENRAAIGSSHDHVLIYARKPAQEWKSNRNKLAATEAGFSNPDNDPRGPWRSIPFSAQGYRANQMYKITTPTGVELDPPKGRCWGATQPVFDKFLSENRVYFPKGGDGRPRIKLFMGDEDGLVPMTWWPSSDFGDNDSAKKEMLELFPDREAFGTPKPERLLANIIHIATNPGDLVLDSFAGSGTTGAVAHKMGRRWIMVELGDHCDTHVLPRIKKVIDDADNGGVTEAVGWKGGGGFRYFDLAPSLLEQDRYGNWVISKDYRPAMLAEAMCKHVGFTYAPSQHADEYWSHGYSTEKDFIYVTTQQLTHDACRKISEDVGPERSLLVCCKAFNADPDKFDNLTLVKIPSSILTKCEWGRDDYSLNIVNLPLVDQDNDEEADEPSSVPVKRGRKSKSSADAELSLFDIPGAAEDDQ